MTEICRCGTFAAATCVRCSRATCAQHYFIDVQYDSAAGSHIAVTPNGHVTLKPASGVLNKGYAAGGPACQWCRITAGEEVAATEAAQRRDREATRLEHVLKHLGAIADPIERLIVGIRTATSNHEYGNSFVVPEVLARAFPELWPTGEENLDERPWDSAAIARWFAIRAKAEGVPTLEVRTRRFAAPVRYWMTGPSSVIETFHWRDEVHRSRAPVYVTIDGEILQMRPIPYPDRKRGGRSAVRQPLESRTRPEFHLTGLHRIAEILNLRPV